MLFGRVFDSERQQVARTVWLLAPGSRDERRTRDLTFRADDLQAQIKGFRTVKMADDTQASARDAFVEQLRKRQSQLQAVATTMGSRCLSIV